MHLSLERISFLLAFVEPPSYFLVGTDFIGLIELEDVMVRLSEVEDVDVDCLIICEDAAGVGSGVMGQRM